MNSLEHTIYHILELLMTAIVWSFGSDNHFMWVRLEYTCIRDAGELCFVKFLYALCATVAHA